MAFKKTIDHTIPNLSDLEYEGGDDLNNLSGRKYQRKTRQERLDEELKQIDSSRLNLNSTKPLT